MLVLSRKKDELVVITVGSQTIFIKVVEIRTHRGVARLGFEASPEVRIHRKEIYDAIDKEQGS